MNVLEEIMIAVVAGIIVHYATTAIDKHLADRQKKSK